MKALIKEVDSKEPVFKEMESSFDELTKTAKKIDDVSDLPNEISKVEQYRQRWENLKKGNKENNEEIRVFVDLHKKYADLRDKLHDGVPKQIADSLKDILFIGANTKEAAKRLKRVKVSYSDQCIILIYPFKCNLSRDLA